MSKSLVAKIAAAVVTIACLVGVAVFDTYPTYLKKEVQLTQDECSQVATLVAAHAFRLQNPSEPIPAGAQAELDKATRLSKRVAKYLIEKSDPGAFAELPPMFLWTMLMQSCVAIQGRVTLD